MSWPSVCDLTRSVSAPGWAEVQHSCTFLIKYASAARITSRDQAAVESEARKRAVRDLTLARYRILMQARNAHAGKVSFHIPTSTSAISHGRDRAKEQEEVTPTHTRSGRDQPI